MQKPRVQARYVILLLFGAGFAACCLGVCPLMDAFGPNETGAILVYFCFGAISAAAALLAILGVLWSGPFWVRKLVSFGVGVLLFSFWLIGFAASLAGRSRSFADGEWKFCLVVLLCMPLAFLAIQSPLWLTRLLFRWDIVLVSPPATPPNLRPLTIRDMLVATGFIGFALAGARLAKTLAMPSGSSSGAEFWIATGVVLLSCIGISFASTLPIVLATLRAPRPALALLGLVGYSAFALAITFTVIGLIAGRGPQLWTMFGMSATAVTFVAGAATPLLVGRQIGIRLRWGRESVGHLEPAESAIVRDANILLATSDEKETAG